MEFERYPSVAINIWKNDELLIAIDRKPMHNAYNFLMSDDE
jgi:hypothetical protein